MDWTEEQSQAINESGKNIIVSAGAGSGKTAVLTARVMRILKEGTHINELLVLTFTKAAAAEMKQRIREAIEEDPSLKGELELIDQSYITTFDSYALSVVKKYHYLLNISNNISISESSIIDMEKTKIMDKIFDKYYENKPNKFVKLIKDFCVKDDKQIKKFILKIATKIDGLPSKDDYLNTYLNNYIGEEYTNKLYSEYINIINTNKERLDNQYEDLLSILDEDNYNKIYSYGNKLYSSKEYNDIYNSIIELPSFPTIKLDEDDTIIKDRYHNSIDEFKKTIIPIGNEESIKEGLNITYDYIEIIIDIIKDYLKELHNYKEKYELYDFQDIALLSIKILQEHPEVREEIKYSFKQIMVDEYQDTNDIQETFVSLIENNNVYMVGDIKQSIYRFRNANPYIFKNKYDKYSLKEDGIKIDLLNNFRSRKEVLKGVNDIFDLIMDNTIGGAEYHESHRMIFGNTSYDEKGSTKQNYNLEVLEYSYDKKETDYSQEEIEIFTIARDIQNKIKNKYQVFDKKKKVLKDITYNDFVILIDRSTDFELYKKVFEYLGIPLTQIADEDLSNSNDIYIFKNILDFIIKINKKEYDTHYKYDFISIARSYLYNYNDEEIFKYFLNNSIESSSIYKDFQTISESLSSLSISSLFEEIIKITNMYEKIIEVGDIDLAITRISTLMDIADNLSTLGYNIYSFSEYLNELLDNDDIKLKYSKTDNDTNAVKIMTIHKSKGLEYHICYYPGLYKKFNTDDIKDRILYDNKYGIIIPYYKEGIRDSIAKYLVKYNYLQEEVSEKIRLFYVALTRAKEKMIIINPKQEVEDNELDSNNTIDINIRRKYNSFSNILDSIKTKISNYYKDIDINDLKLTKEYLYKRSKKELKNTTKDIIKVKEISINTEEEINTKHFSKETHNLIDKNTYNNMQLGLKVHEILELLDFNNPNLNLIEDKFIKDKITKFLNNKILNNLKEATIYKEHEFIFESDNTEYHGIIDLMLEYKDHIDIIDYKLNNIKDDNYLNQLNGYKDYINSISNKKVNIYLYSIINEELEEL